MDQREQKLQQSPGIFHRLFNFIMKSLVLVTQFLKTLTLRRLVNRSFGRVSLADGAGSSMMQPMTQGTSCEEAASGTKVEPQQANGLKNLEPFGTTPCCSSNDHVNKDNNDSGKRLEEELAPLSTTAAQAKAPKKMVSINDRVEEIVSTSVKKKKTTERLNSKDDQPNPPLRSILKVGSKLNGKSDSFSNPSSDG